jgi:hypothetical protein
VQLIQYRQPMACVRLEPDEPDPVWATGPPLVSISRGAEELSVICPTTCLPDNLPGPVAGPFIVVRIAGALAFSQIGVLVSLLSPLSNAGIPVLTVSTYDTDWVLVEASRGSEAASVWRGAGYTVTEEAS